MVIGDYLDIAALGKSNTHPDLSGLNTDRSVSACCYSVLVIPFSPQFGTPVLWDGLVHRAVIKGLLAYRG